MSTFDEKYIKNMKLDEKETNSIFQNNSKKISNINMNLSENTTENTKKCKLRTNLNINFESKKTILHFTTPWNQKWSRAIQIPDSKIINNSCKFEKLKKNGKVFPSQQNLEAEPPPIYDIDNLDFLFLEKYNASLKHNKILKNSLSLSKELFENLIFYFEYKTNMNINDALRKEPGAGIEYDNNQGCNSCMSEESCEANPIVFCDGCDIAVHQLCYGIETIPEGKWFCDICSQGIDLKNLLCCICGTNYKSGFKIAYDNSNKNKSLTKRLENTQISEKEKIRSYFMRLLDA